MPERSPLLEDRSPFVVVEAVLDTVADICDEYEDAAAVWDAFVRTKGDDQREYLNSIRDSRHSMFYYLHQEIYEFGIAATGMNSEEFCPTSGRRFMRHFFLESVFPFLQVAMASPEAFQRTIVDMLTSYLHRYAASRYELLPTITDSTITLVLRPRIIDPAIAYLEEHGLDPVRCFVNSTGFVFGAFNAFLEQVVQGYSEREPTWNTDGASGTMVFPVTGTDRFTYESLITTLMGYTRDLMSRQNTVFEDERREHDLIMASSAMRSTWNRIRKASRSHEIVLLRGESGTGKSFIARKIHALSPRADGPFVEVCLTSDIGSDNMIQSDLFGHRKGAFTGAVEHKQGLFSLASGGTIFLDEIGDASPELQAKLLRVLESSTFKRLGDTADVSVDVRVIVATNRDLEDLVRQGTFREDLYYRISVIPIELPSLRDRPEDIGPLAGYLLERCARGTPPRTLAPEVLDTIRQYQWPGNIRELDHALKHAVAMSDGPEITLSDLPGTLAAAAPTIRRPVDSGRAPEAPDGAPVVDVSALREAIRTTDRATLEATDAPWHLRSHVDHAKRLYLATLIEELSGDITAITRFWDRSSTKTIRKLISEYGLMDALQTARAGAPDPEE